MGSRHGVISFESDDKGTKKREFRIPSISMINVQKLASVTQELLKDLLKGYLKDFTPVSHNPRKLGGQGGTNFQSTASKAKN